MRIIGKRSRLLEHSRRFLTLSLLLLSSLDPSLSAANPSHAQPGGLLEGISLRITCSLATGKFQNQLCKKRVAQQMQTEPRTEEV